MWELAFDDRGLVLDLTKVPDDILKKMVDWRNERVEEENAKLPSR